MQACLMAMKAISGWRGTSQAAGGVKVVFGWWGNSRHYLSWNTEQRSTFKRSVLMIMEVVEIETENLKAYVVDETIAEHVTRLKNL
jgi:hypothetical protein